MLTVRRQDLPEKFYPQLYTAPSRMIHQVMILIEQYLTQNIELEITPSNEEKVIIGWEKAPPIDLGPYNELYEIADRVTPITIPGKLDPKHLTFQTTLDAIRNGFYLWAEEQKKKDPEIKRIPQIPDDLILKLIEKLFPNITSFWETHEFFEKEKDGKFVLDKKGNFKKYKTSKLHFKGIRIKLTPP